MGLGCMEGDRCRALEENVMRRSVLPWLSAAFVLVPAVVLAHTGHSDTSGFMHGFRHPITGIDHMLAMTAVGVLAAQIGGSARWLVPLAFVSVMAIGGIFGMAGVSPSFAELGVAMSVIVFGMAIAVPLQLKTVAAVIVVGFFALFHGYVHGAEMPVTASMLSYVAGFVSATALLHMTGVALGAKFDLPRMNRPYRVARVAGGAMALFGVALLTGF
ncbi:HupE/UreJ family protein [Steroidobacter agaridevorans]|uniref:HupE/UreJ family protein n=1 Tax=Steroidobacter agaridevorans TaxID=2695856 RepID=UPI00192A1AA2|nr:HupE/UreJ family protein [Steroidobacter agaridevorans]